MIRSQYVDTTYGQVHLRTAGSADLPPLILLHQTASSSIMYAAMMTLLSADYWVIALDTPGFGQSFVPAEKPSTALYAAAFYAALERLGIANCYLFGHHTGAAIAVQMAHDYPALVHKLCLAGPPLLTAQQITYLEKTLLPFEPTGDYISAIWQRTAQKSSDLPANLLYREALLTLHAGAQLSAAYHAVFEQDFAGQLATITCPTLLLAGEHDSLRASLEPTHALLPNSSMAVIPNAGTFVCDLQPTAVVELLMEFLV